MEYYEDDEDEQVLLKELNNPEKERNKDDEFVSIMNKKEFNIDELEEIL